MSFENEQHLEIIQSRILLTALINTVLFCWNHGCTIANPYVDIRFLARNSHLVINLLVAYFKNAAQKGQESTNENDCVLPSNAPGGAVESISTIQIVHEAIMASKRDCASQIVGNSPSETIKNLILFFESHVNKFQK